MNNMIRLHASVLAAVLDCDEGSLVQKIPNLGEIEDKELYFHISEELFTQLNLTIQQEKEFFALVLKKAELKKKLAMYKN